MTVPDELKKPSMELILYRMGEMSGKIDGVGVKLDNYQKETNDKISKINTDLAVATAMAKRDEEESDRKEKPRWDNEKIVMAALGLVSTSLLIIQNLIK
jgi:hypothetical protein